VATDERAIAEQLRKRFLERLPDAAPAWDRAPAQTAVLGRAVDVPVHYTETTGAYMAAYFGPGCEEYVDLSVSFASGPHQIAYWPLQALRREGVWSFHSSGVPVLPPLYARDASERQRKAVGASALAALRGLAGELGAAPVTTSESTRGGVVSEWLREALEAAKGCATEVELWVDLSWTMDEIRANLRKSYKSLVNQAAGLWKAEVLGTTLERERFDAFKRLHFEVAGRATRSDESWDEQYRAVQAGESFLVLLSDGAGALVGGGLFLTSRTQGLYGVAAYRRELFDKPIGHLVQWEAIRHMREAGLQWYKIGDRPYPFQTPPPTPKELSIAEFKEGFATHRFPRIKVTL
jgi:FemAB family protein